jgi:hypothetical protein
MISPEALSSRLVPLDIPPARWRAWLSASISIALLAAIILQFDRDGLARLKGAVPVSPGFWMALTAYYVALPAAEWVIYRRLWHIPASGIVALLRKLVSNELLLGYSGELSFYTWARRRAGLTNTPFAAIKDVSILSAAAGNVATLTMILFGGSHIGRFGVAVSPKELMLSVAILLALCIGSLLLRRKLFSLPAADLRFILAAHLIRVASTTALMAMMWHFALPDVPIGTWILLSALQLLVTRLPFVPNKDLLFAGAAMFLTGGASAIGTLAALIATLILTMHLLIGASITVFDLARLAKEP